MRPFTSGNCFLIKTLPVLLIVIWKADTAAQAFLSESLQKDSTKFIIETFWKGTVTLNPHGLYFGRGLAHDGSFCIGDSGSLIRVDFITGQQQILVKANDGESAGASVISPDNQTIAFSWSNGISNHLMILSPQPSESLSSQPGLLIKAAAGEHIKPHDWSPDGKWILVRLTDKGVEKIALISVKDGSVKLIKDLGSHSCTHISFSPDGRNIVYDYSNKITDLSDIRLCNVDGSDEKLLIKDSGAGPYWSPDGKYIFFLANKKLCALQMAKSEPIGDPILVKEGIEFFSPLGFLSNGVFMFGESSTTKLNIYISGLDRSGPGSNHVPVIISNRASSWNTNAIWSPDGKRLAYISRDADGQDVVVLRSQDNGTEEDVTEIKGSIVNWFPDNRTLLL